MRGLRHNTTRPAPPPSTIAVCASALHAFLPTPMHLAPPYALFANAMLSTYAGPGACVVLIHLVARPSVAHGHVGFGQLLRPIPQTRLHRVRSTVGRRAA